MDRTEFKALVAKMEQLAQQRPALYPWRVVGWAVLGYAFLMLVVGTLLALCVATVWLLQRNAFVAGKLLFLFVPATYVIARALWIKFSAPDGEPLTRHDAPALFAMIDDLSRQLRTPRIHDVRITPEMNAAVCQTPRLGFLGWHRNYLMLGLPLMKGLTVEQFRAVVAHEMGHLSRGHARLGNWIYRLRQIWSNLDREYEQQAQLGAGVIRRFFNWYAPRFNAISFPLARANEFEADAAAARVTSPRAAAQALTGVNVLARYLEQKFWPDIHAAAKEHAAPAFAPFSGFVGSHILQVPDAERSGWLNEALKRETTFDDTHPALSERLRAFGGQPEFLPPSEGEGADTLLGAALADLEARFDDQWRTNVGPSWAQFHQETQAARVRLAQLREAPPMEAESEHPMLEIADLEERLGGQPAIVLGWRRRAFARFPASPAARFVLGRHLLQANDPEGIDLVKPLLEKQDFAAAVAAELRDFQYRAGDQRGAEQWHDRFIDASVIDHEVRRERECVLTSDQFAPHALDDDKLAQIKAALQGILHLRRLYIVRKVTRHYTDVPFLVIGFSCTPRFRRADAGRSAAAQEDIRSRLELSGDWMLFSVDGENRQFEKLLKKVAASRIR